MSGLYETLVVAALFVATIGCGSPTQRIVEPREQAIEPKPRLLPRPPALEALVSAVEQLPSELVDPSHAAVVRTLRRLADALDITHEPRDEQHAARIRELARRLEASSHRSLQHVDLMTAALNQALAAIEQRIPQRPDAAVRASYVHAATATRRIDPVRPLLEQQPQTLNAFSAIAHALLVVQGMESPFSIGQEPSERNAHLFRERAAAASAAVAKLATTGSWDPAVRAAADALDAIALAIETAPASRSLFGQLDDTAVLIRFEAARLRQTGTLSLQKSDRAKAGLLSAVGALEQLGRGAASHELSGMVDRARRAAEAVDDDAMFEFQRAAIQEAFRSTVDALLVVASVTDSRSA